VSDIGDRADYQTQIQLRFCVRDVSYRQPDKFPSRVSVNVNSGTAQLPVGLTFLILLSYTAVQMYVFQTCFVIFVAVVFHIIDLHAATALLPFFSVIALS